MAQIPGVKIVVDGVEGFTDENGVAVFIADLGEYSWTANKAGYIAEGGKVLLNRDITVEITLEPTPTLTRSLIPTVASLGLGLAMVLLPKS